MGSKDVVDWLLCAEPSAVHAEGAMGRPTLVIASGDAQLDGETGFAEVFFDDARVPIANRLGGEHKGWSVAMATAGFERGLMLRSPARFQETARKLVALYRENEATAPANTREEVGA